jgi:hypothetical protein
MTFRSVALAAFGFCCVALSMVAVRRRRSRSRLPQARAKEHGALASERNRIREHWLARATVALSPFDHLAQPGPTR